MRNIKILQFPIANTFGGITHYALGNWRWMDKKLFQCDFATMSRSLWFAPDLERAGSRIHYIPCYAELDPATFTAAFKEALSVGYDVVHLHTKYWKGFLVEKLCMEMGVPKVIVHAHATGCDVRAGEREAEKARHLRVRSEFSESLATDFWACSREASDWLFGSRIPKERVKIMRNAIDAGSFRYNAESRARLREELGLGGKFVVGSVGRLAPEKNHAFLLEAFAKACEARDDIALVIAGDGPLRDELEEKAARLGISGRTFFLGMRGDVADLYQAMDLFAFPSRFEGLGLALVEAQASGLRCLASEAVPREADAGGDVRFLPLDVAVWSGAIAAAEPYGRADMEAALARNGYDIRRQIQVIEREYRSAVTERNSNAL